MSVDSRAAAAVASAELDAAGGAGGVSSSCPRGRTSANMVVASGSEHLLAFWLHGSPLLLFVIRVRSDSRGQQPRARHRTRHTQLALPAGLSRAALVQRTVTMSPKRFVPPLIQIASFHLPAYCDRRARRGVVRPRSVSPTWKPSLASTSIEERGLTRRLMAWHWLGRSRMRQGASAGRTQILHDWRLARWRAGCHLRARSRASACRRQRHSGVTGGCGVVPG